MIFAATPPASLQEFSLFPLFVAPLSQGSLPRLTLMPCLLFQRGSAGPPGAFLLVLVSLSLQKAPRGAPGCLVIPESRNACWGGLCLLMGTVPVVKPSCCHTKVSTEATLNDHELHVAGLGPPSPHQCPWCCGSGSLWIHTTDASTPCAPQVL